jgi:hypothetical protein
MSDTFIANLFIKEIKICPTLQKYGFHDHYSRLIADMATPVSSDPLVIKGGVKHKVSWTRVLTSSWFY